MISMCLINEKICKYFNVELNYPFQNNRKVRVIYMRQIFHYLSRELNKLQFSFATIGKYNSTLKTYHHATVMNSCKTIKGYIDVHPHVRKDVESIIKMIYEQ